jgi:hypothetical protein
VDVMAMDSLGPRGAARLALAGHRLRRLATLPQRSATRRQQMDVKPVFRDIDADKHRTHRGIGEFDPLP